MRMRVHELHAMLVHTPLVLLPTAALVDFAAATSGKRDFDRLGSTLWWAGATSGLVTGLAGMAASQEVKTDDERASDMMWVHGFGNLALVLTAIGMAGWRTRNRASTAQAIGGMVATAASMYTAYLGGKLVYGLGVGVNSMPQLASTGVREETPLLSSRAPLVLARDAVRGLGWLLARAKQVFTGKKRVHRTALGLGIEERRPNGSAPS
jgi:uncharacterized membrane protein